MKKVFFCFLIILVACNHDPTVDKTVEPANGQANKEKRMKDAILRYPDSLLLKENLIQYFRDSGNYSNAIKEAANALSKDSLNARLWKIKATLHFEDADTSNAIRSFEKAISISPDPQYMISLGTLYAQTKDPRAIRMADILLQTNKTKSDKEAYYIKGLYYNFNNEKIKAIEYFDKCLSLNYTFMDAYREKAIALYDLEKYTESLVVLDKAITLQNNFDEGYYYSGKCLEKLNRIPEAIQSYQNALVYDPGYVEAKEALNRLTANSH
ncbi:MAG: tetratricopeptide repeat protein [Ferruginibacter sp.]